MRESVNPQKRKYIEETFARHPSPVMDAVWAKGEELRAGMQLSAAEGKMLGLFAQLAHAKHIVEVGTFVGYSALWMWYGSGKQARITTYEIEPKHAAIARGFFAQAGAGGNIHVAEGDMLEQFTKNPPKETLDMIFIDAEKRSYPLYLKALLPHLRSGGLVVGDNALLFDQVWKEQGQIDRDEASRSAWQGMREFHAMLAGASQFDSGFVLNAEGWAVAVKK